MALGFTSLSALAVPIIFLANLDYCRASLPSSLIDEHFAMKRVGIITLKTCRFADAVKLTRYLNKERGFYTKVMRSVAEMNATDDIQFHDASVRVGVFIDMTCGENRQFLEEAVATHQLGLRWSWLIDVGSSMNILQDINLGFVNDVTVVICNEANGERLVLHHAFTQPWPRQELTTINVGYWTADGGLVYQEPHRKYSLEGGTLKAAIFITKEIYHEDQLYNELQNKTYMPSMDSANRYFFAICLHMADYLNFSIELVKANDWGYPLPNGSFSGMMGMIARDSADLTITPLWTATERMNAGTPLLPIQRFLFPFAFKQPKRTGTYKALALQFQTEVWVYTALMAVITCLTLSAIHWLRNSVKRRRRKTFCRREEESLSYNAVIVIGAMSQQGLMSDPTDIARKIASLSLLFCFLFVATYYNAATMNALLSPSPNTIRNLKELMSSDIPLALNDAPYFSHEIRKLILDQEVRDRVNDYGIGMISLELGLQHILKGGAFCCEDFTLYKGIEANFLDEQKCDLSMVQSSPSFPTTIWIPKNSPYKEIMFQGILRAKEHGLVDRQYRYWYPAKPECLVNQQWLWVGLEAVTIALVIYFVGFVCCFIIFIGEIASSLPFFRKKIRAVFKVK